jgi:putative alpha-1,2-mannosidase
MHSINSQLFSYAFTISSANVKDFYLIKMNKFYRLRIMNDALGNSSDLNKYIQSAQFNGKDMDIPWFSREELLKGGTLTLVMGPKPNKSLWANADSGVLYK